MKHFGTIVVVVAGAALFAVLYSPAQTLILNLDLVSQESVRALATDGPVGGEFTVLMFLGMVFFLEVLLAALLSALPAGAVVAYLAAGRPFATALFLAKRPR